jgi:ribosomal protein S18 acetylase RimI-like enzyme
MRVPLPRPTLRRFAPEDLPVLQAERAAAFRPVFRCFARIVGEEIAAIAFAHADEEQARLLDSLCAENAAATMLVAGLDSAIVGFIAYTIDRETRIGEIGLNAVHPAHAGRGIGTAMYRNVLRRMKARGMRVATVGTGGDPSHEAARRAYAKAGFGHPIPSLTLYRTL